MEENNSPKFEVTLSSVLDNLRKPNMEEITRIDGVDDQPDRRNWRIDQALQKLSYSANSGGVSLGITLQVGGLMVTGTLASHERYFDEMNKRFMQVFDENEQDREFIEAWKSWADVIFPKGYKFGDTEEGEVGMIHLIDAYFFLGTTQTPSEGEGIPWRGPLEAVDGFFIGRLARSQSSVTRDLSQLQNSLNL